MSIKEKELVYLEKSYLEQLDSFKRFDSKVEMYLTANSFLLSGSLAFFSNLSDFQSSIFKNNQLVLKIIMGMLIVDIFLVLISISFGRINGFPETANEIYKGTIRLDVDEKALEDNQINRTIQDYERIIQQFNHVMKVKRILFFMSTFVLAIALILFFIYIISIEGKAL